MMSYSGKLALITGASSGIGAEFARELHARGCSVILVARREKLLAGIVDQLNKTRPDSASYRVVDLTLRGSSVDALESLEKFIKESEIDILVNNAGRGSFGFFDTLSLKEEEKLVALNVTATLRLAHAALAGMKKRGAGALIAVSSIAGFQPLPFMATYAATKAFNFSHALGLRHELKRYGVRVLAVCPGATETDFFGVARTPGTLAGVKRDPAAKVARESLRALEKGRAVVIPCLRPKILAFLCGILPDVFTTWIAGMVLYSPLAKQSGE